jgi:hypothetical protein
MNRAKAILLVLSLLAAPVSLLARGSACGERSCCRRLCCEHCAQMAHSGERGMACHRHSAPTQDCAMTSACNHTLDYGFVSPLPLTVLQAADSLALPQLADRIMFPSFVTASGGFQLAPFEPPRN